MAEYIDKEALINALEADFNRDWQDYVSEDYIDGVRDEYDDVLKIICQQKAADVQPVKRGEWGKRAYDRLQCSYCGKCEDVATDFCPNCGADMRGR